MCVTGSKVLWKKIKREYVWGYWEGGLARRVGEGLSEEVAFGQSLSRSLGREQVRWPGWESLVCLGQQVIRVTGTQQIG